MAVQVKSVLDGVKNRKSKFLFFGEELNIVGTVGMFITMNPGYAGRTELPENLKTLFRYEITNKNTRDLEKRLNAQVRVKIKLRIN